MSKSLQVALDWTARDGRSQRWLTRRVHAVQAGQVSGGGFTRTRVRNPEDRWEVEFYCDAAGNIELRNALTGDVLFTTTAPTTLNKGK